MRIAICDDNERDLNLIENFLSIYKSERKLSFSVDRFSSGEEFLLSKKQYDIIFMDVYMKGITGIQAIAKLPSPGLQCIIFTTTSKDHAVEAFELGAVHYLLKPVTMSNFREAISRCLSHIERTYSKVLEVKTNHGIVAVPIDSILYIEVFNKVCSINYGNDCIQTYVSLSEMFEKLDKDIFMRPQRSFIVNMERIEAFLPDRIVLETGKEVFLSRNKKTELKKQYQRFLFNLARRD